MDVLISLLQSLFSSLVPSVVTVGVVLLLVLVLRDEDRPPVPVLARSPQGGWRPMGGPGMPPVYWHARISRPDLLWDRRFGTLCLANGHAWFALDHPDPGSVWRPEYLGPVAGSYVARRPLLVLGHGDLDWWVNGHQLRIVVGRTRINRWVDNDLKDLASRAEAHTFVSMLMANGARLGAPPQLRELR